LYRRGCDFVESFRRVLARATELAVDLVIHAGDLFDTAEPSEGAIAAACEPIWEVARAGIPVIIVPGNHERSILPHLLLLNHANIQVLREPATVLIRAAGGCIAVAGFPCIRRRSAAEFAGAVEATGWQRAAADVRMLAVHQTFEGARCGPGNFRFRAGEDVVPREAVPEGFDYVAAGHVHRHQTLRRGESRNGSGPGGMAGPPIVYCGSPDRIAFAELGEPKGCVLVEYAGGALRPRFLEHQVRPMAVASVDVTGMSGAGLVEAVLARARELPACAAAQIRLTGQATKRGLAGLRLTARVREARPDLLVAVSSGAVEWITERALFRQARAGAESAFEVLDAPRAEVKRVAAADVGTIAAECGTYCLYDAAGRLLYVGKGLNVRARLRSHLRGCSAAGQFGDWSQQIAYLEVRPAASELEALLVEAELIRRLTPPFNRQMRLWKRYCYLRRGQQAFGQLEVCAEPRGRVVLGPLRSRAGAERAMEALADWFGLAQCGPQERSGAVKLSGTARLCRRYFSGDCSGPCGGREDEAEYAAQVARRDALLAGEVTEDVSRIAEEFQARDTSPQGERERRLRTLVDLCRTAELLRRARGLLNCLLVSPGSGGGQTAAVVTSSGLHLAAFGTTAREMREMKRWHGEKVGHRQRGERPVLPKPVADTLCTAARVLVRHPDVYKCRRA
jgi:exonuclease SbcD